MKTALGSGVIVLGAIAAVAPSIGAQGTTAGVYTLVPVTYGRQLKTPDGRAVFDYMTKKPEDVGSGAQ